MGPIDARPVPHAAGSSSLGVSLVAQTGLQFDLRSAQGKFIASLMAALAEFERDLLRERVRSGIAAARNRGVVFGRRPRQRIKADRYATKVLKLVGEGQSYREISHRLGLARTPSWISSSATALRSSPRILSVLKNSVSCLLLNYRRSSRFRRNTSDSNEIQPASGHFQSLSRTSNGIQ